jgi:hypothetical protein
MGSRKPGKINGRAKAPTKKGPERNGIRFTHMGAERAAWKRPPLPQVPGQMSLATILGEGRRVRDREQREEEEQTTQGEIEAKDSGIESDEIAKEEEYPTKEEVKLGWPWKRAFFDALTQMIQGKKRNLVGEFKAIKMMVREHLAINEEQAGAQ